jgi:protein-S-isoprenylcysteine O-methyltransferase Ste14
MLFYIYDINEIKKLNKMLKVTFYLGIILQISATTGIIIDNLTYLKISVSGIVISLLGFILLIYSLFFALPFEETYIKISEKRKVHKKGLYAMSRHPGVVFYIVFYLGLAILQPTLLNIGTYIIWSLLNISYIIFQDIWTFPRTFEDYNKYRKSTPFLIPTIKSIKSSIETI